MELIERCLKLLETNGREPEEWPVPISRADLRVLVENTQLLDITLIPLDLSKFDEIVV
jgi:hypothetical protein